jgi:hypothetical protein
VPALAGSCCWCSAGSCCWCTLWVAGGSWWQGSWGRPGITFCGKDWNSWLWRVVAATERQLSSLALMPVQSQPSDCSCREMLWHGSSSVATGAVALMCKANDAHQHSCDDPPLSHSAGKQQQVQAAGGGPLGPLTSVQQVKLLSNVATGRRHGLLSSTLLPRPCCRFPWLWGGVPASSAGHHHSVLLVAALLLLASRGVVLVGLCTLTAGYGDPVVTDGAVGRRVGAGVGGRSGCHGALVVWA